MTRVPEKLLKLRKSYNLSQDFLANKLGISIFDYMALENGRAALNEEMADLIADLYKIKSEELIDDNKEVHISYSNNKFNEEGEKYHIREFLNNLRCGKYNIAVFIGLVSLVFFILVVSMLPKSYNISVSMNKKPSDILSANRDTVVFLNDGINVSGKDSIEFKDENIVKVVSGINYFVGLTEDGKVKTSGFNVKYQKEIEKIKNAVDIASGESHILVLLNNGKVKCIGNNDYGQCEVKKWNKVSKIYADNYGSIAVSEDGILYSGKIPFHDSLKEYSFRQVEFDDQNLYLLLNDGTLKVFGNCMFDLSEFNDLSEFAIDKSFIAGLKNDGTVVISIDNYIISEKVKHFKDIITIDAGESYLVVSDGKKVFGIGDDKYNQFEEQEIELKPLDPIENVQIEKVENDVVVTFDYVLNAQAYLLSIEELNINVRTADNRIVLPLSLFESDKKYIFMLTAVNVYDLYLDSETKHLVFSHTVEDEKEESNKKDVIVVEIPFIVKEFVNEPVDDFIAFLKAHDYDVSTLESEVINNCENNMTIISVDGLEAGEELTSSKLQEKVISYKYCEVGAN